MQNPKDISLLVVDDEDDLREAIVFDFKRSGFQVLEASNGRAAMELVRSHPIDVVLTDVRMPGGDGIELLDNIKALNPRKPVVMFVTGFTDLTITDAFDKGADAVFSKPFDRKALLAAVLRAANTLDGKWGTARSERFETDFEIKLSFPELNQTVEGRVINIGRGGFFITLADKPPTLGSRAVFQILFEHGPVQGLSGQGIVRWVRAQPEGDKPAGYGVEFEYLEDATRSAVIELINQLKTKAFIPKS